MLASSGFEPKPLEAFLPEDGLQRAKDNSLSVSSLHTTCPRNGEFACPESQSSQNRGLSVAEGPRKSENVTHDTALSHLSVLCPH